MMTPLNRLRALASSPLTHWVAVPAVCTAALVAVFAQTVPSPMPPTVNLSSEPLYAQGVRAKPTLTLALSVEFPTVGAQYVDAPGTSVDASYSPDNKYIGYFNSESCYTYERSPDDEKGRYFRRIGDAVNHGCGGVGFSGNFMNWATSSAIDVLRLGLTGGDRVNETDSVTVLQRAVLPAGRFWNDRNFPSKQLAANLAQEALPSRLLGSHTGTVYVANCFNRVHFGTDVGGSCDAPGANGSLGLSTGQAGVVTSYSGALPPDFSSTACAGEDQTCAVTGTREIAYGAGTSWRFLTTTSSQSCSNAVFGDPLPSLTKQCFTRSAPDARDDDDGLTVDNFFYARVRVCETDAAGELTDLRSPNSLCVRYPSGHYKPIGTLQRYSDNIRVAAFGYLNDNTADPQRAGGVLRVPMKYVGPRAFNDNYGAREGVNESREWDPTTGVFIADPDRVPGAPNSGLDSNRPGQPISGVINYVNQFGRTGAFGQYKTYDPVSELYYESLRYLQGLPPSRVVGSSATNVVQGLDNPLVADALRDGFPAYASYTDPHPAVDNLSDYSCVRNSILGIGDTNTNNDHFLPGNRSGGAGDIARPANLAANEPDFREWTRVVGAFESNAAINYKDGNGVERTTGNPNPPNGAAANLEDLPVGDGGTYYIAGAAYWANTHDIRGEQWTDAPEKQRPGMRVRTYWLDVNEFGEQSNTDQRRSRNQFYLAGKYGGFDDVTGTGDPYKRLGAPTSTGEKTYVVDPTNRNWERQDSNPDLQEAKTYFLSSSAQAVLDSLEQIFADSASAANSIAGGAISTSRVTSDGGVIYQAQFDPAAWSGDVVAYDVSLSGNSLLLGDSPSSVWTNSSGQAVGAAGKLDELNPDSRNIYVGYPSTASLQEFNSGVFTWDAVSRSANTSISDALYAVGVETADIQGQNRLNYLRGDRTLESGGMAGGTLRARNSRLGDIVNSGITYVAAPTQSIADPSYADFYSANRSRVQALYVGANDGMLHAFNAADGNELFAYIPSWVVPNLIALTATPYVHRSYVDATPTAAEANLGSTEDADWRTVLVGGAGGGGQGIFALDVTDPLAFAGGAGNDKILWEFTDKHDSDVGNVIGSPQILKFNVAAGDAEPDYRYFAVVASGVNNHAPDANASDTGEPALFFLRLDKPKDAAWELNVNYFKVKFPVKSAAGSLASGMVNFTARAGFAGEVTDIYAGDLQGNLWKLNFRAAVNAPDWSLATLSFYKNGGTAIPLFIATDGATSPNRQPISMAPALSFGPGRSILVSFGTGRYLSSEDNAAPYASQSVYTLFDDNTVKPDEAGSIEAAIAGRGRLQPGTATSTSVSVSPFAFGRPGTDTDTTTRAGWYFDFSEAATTGSQAGTGERQISGFGVLAGRLIFGSVIPGATTCDGGSGNLYVVNTFSGNGTLTVSTEGILGEPFLTEVGYSTLTVSDSTGQRRETSNHQIIKQGSSGLGTSPGFSILNTAGRLSWREISNYQDLRGGS